MRNAFYATVNEESTFAGRFSLWVFVTEHKLFDRSHSSKQASQSQLILKFS